LVFLLILASLDRNELTLALLPLLLVNPFESTREDDEEEEVTSGSRIAALVVVVLLVRIVRFTVGLLLLSVDVFLPVVVGKEEREQNDDEIVVFRETVNSRVQDGIRRVRRRHRGNHGDANSSFKTIAIAVTVRSDPNESRV